jgi:hypothetical protein
VNQSQRIVIGVAVFAAAMLAWASFAGFNWWNPASSFFFQQHHNWGFAPFLVLFIIFASKRHCRRRDREGDPDYRERSESAERPRR